MLARHRERGAGVTVVTSEVPKAEASRQAVVEVAGDGRLSGFHYKPEEPPTTRVAAEVFAFRTRLLLDTLDELAAGGGELRDFGHGLLPRPVAAAGPGRPGPDAVVGGPGDDGPALVPEEAQVRGGARVPPGGRFGHDGPEEATT